MHIILSTQTSSHLHAGKHNTPAHPHTPVQSHAHADTRLPASGWFGWPRSGVGGGPGYLHPASLLPRSRGFVGFPSASQAPTLGSNIIAHSRAGGIPESSLPRHSSPTWGPPAGAKGGRCWGGGPHLPVRGSRGPRGPGQAAAPLRPCAPWNPGPGTDRGARAARGAAGALPGRSAGRGRGGPPASSTRGPESRGAAPHN